MGPHTTLNMIFSVRYTEIWMHTLNTTNPMKFWTRYLVWVEIKEAHINFHYENLCPCPRRFFGIISWDPSVLKINLLDVDIFSFSLLNKNIPSIPLNRSVICLRYWIWTGQSLNSTGLYVVVGSPRSLLCAGSRNLGPLHTMVEGREAVNFHQSDCKKPRIQPLDSSH
jgi:hypothetical protein